MAQPSKKARTDDAPSISSAALSSAQPLKKARTGVAPSIASGDASDKAAEAASDEATGAASDQAAQAATDPTPLVCMSGEEILTTFSLGIRQIGLGDMGISSFNRPISGKHVHALGRRIQSVEGFCRFRYKHGWCHSPSETNPLEVAEWTNKIAERDPLIVQVPMVPLYGTWSKGHLTSWLQALKSGSVYWDDTKELMVPDEGQAALMRHLAHGIFMEVFKYEAMIENPQTVKDLISSDNFDHDLGLGETETRLLLCTAGRPADEHSPVSALAKQVGSLRLLEFLVGSRGFGIPCWKPRGRPC